ncbi:MAG TPA: hypothetical protein VFV09_13795 [Actinomycetota bacterium]|jgi:hypothetical protein|nr:hypothetical protein [Actinomycetota bacterium]
MESETPELLPGEQKKVPDPEALPQTVTTAAAFQGKPPVAKEPAEAGNRSGPD